MGKSFFLVFLLVFTSSLLHASSFEEFEKSLKTPHSFHSSQWLEAIHQAEKFFSLDSPHAEDVLHLLAWDIGSKVSFLGPQELKVALNQTLDRIREQAYGRINDPNANIRRVALRAMDAARGALEKDVRILLNAALKDPAPEVRKMATNWLWVVYLEILDSIPYDHLPEDRQILAFDLVATLIQIRDHDSDSHVKTEAGQALKSIESKILEKWFVTSRHFIRETAFVLTLQTLSRYPDVFKLNTRGDLGNREQILKRFLEHSEFLKHYLTDKDKEWMLVTKMAGVIAEGWQNPENDSPQQDIEEKLKEVGSFDDLPLDWARINRSAQDKILFLELKVLLELLVVFSKTNCEAVLLH